MNGLIRAELKEFENISDGFKENLARAQFVRIQLLEKWKFLFVFADLGDLDKPLTPKILGNSNHKVTKHLLYLYSMESFIYTNLNRACRDKNKDEIPQYGAYAAALGYILNSANIGRKDCLKGTTNLYRGLKLTSAELNNYNEGNLINLTGFTSSSMDKNVAIKFAIED